MSSRLSAAHGVLGSAAWLVQEMNAPIKGFALLGDFSTTLEMTGREKCHVEPTHVISTKRSAWSARLCRLASPRDLIPLTA